MNKVAEAGDTVGKALSVLISLLNMASHSTNEILEESDYPKPSASFAQTLVNQNLSILTKSLAHMLGVRLITLAHAAWKTASLAPIASNMF